MKTPSDVEFASQMITHHLAAVRMSVAQLQATSDKFITGLAVRIINAQSKEIDEIQAWIADQSG
jgi:uncharacterized protein (DUF305 family)